MSTTRMKKKMLVTVEAKPIEANEQFMPLAKTLLQIGAVKSLLVQTEIYQLTNLADKVRFKTAVQELEKAEATLRTLIKRQLNHEGDKKC